MANSTPSTTTPTVFISYSHDDEHHCDKVGALAAKLMSQGVKVFIDRWINGEPQEGWPQWMRNSISQAEYTLIICSKTYYQKAMGLKGEKGRGVEWEVKEISEKAYNKDTHNRVIPVFVNQANREYIPDWLRSSNHYQLDGNNDEEQYEKLYRVITNQPKIEKPTLGELKILPPMTENRTTENHTIATTKANKPQSSPSPIVKQLVTKKNIDFNSPNNLLLIAKNKLFQPKKDQFLNYEVSYLTKIYQSEKALGDFLPYSEILDFKTNKLAIEVNLHQDKFKLEPQSNLWQKIATEGHGKLKETKRIKDNENTIRLNKIIQSEEQLTLELQQASYYDQSHSNLILDFEDLDEKISLRTLLRSHYDSQLPNLETRCLANTIGIAALIYYQDENNIVPYMVRRVEKVGVFPSGIHCTSSGVARWPNDTANPSFDSIFTSHMYAELKEEVGLEKTDIIDLTPMAICREFARGGKPQMFYCGFTPLTRKELINKRKTAQKIIKQLKLWPEIEQEKWYQSELVLSSQQLLNEISTYRVTLEGAAALYYGLKYLQTNEETQDL